ncbi:hypothetical protein [Desulfolutivibrio sulfoxidireducens]|uniref:hypothetical protein n=1 Tax=Desulfolutivibrio sulfoxidireducens TaxID=2773299 RepID=UPI00159D695F|nr:hypothetical protein [Desulfolutivibrio sulfoxidireducens]QLA18625.1 hypothetical protein GD604_02195 [Desulfolutivibrio sulfoxidireducens]
MPASKKNNTNWREYGFDYGRSILYTIYRHASGMTDADAAVRARTAASRRHETSAAPDEITGALTEALAARLERLRGERTLSLSA